jgi:glycosidase
MKTWPENPLIYEINTRVWLHDLSRKFNKPVDLASVPGEAWDAIAEPGFDAVWLMGVWERSPMGIDIANNNERIMHDLRQALPDYQPGDNAGSPYCIRRYVTDEHFGGNEGLAIARKELSGRGISLILDFVPNHTAPDHPWILQHPEYFIQGTADDIKNDPLSFMERYGKVYARGKDPFYPAWPDVVQLNAFHPGLRKAVAGVLSDIAARCDGVRCDMAMLSVSRIFENTWSLRAGEKPGTEYWAEVISAVRQVSPDFLFMAEAYWDMEWELQQQGFDYCYDKRLYDRLMHDTAENIRLHLTAGQAYQRKLVRFIENHDEPRAGSAFHPRKHRAAAIVIGTVPGARLFHDGQLEGRRVKLPVFLGRRPDESADPYLQVFYHTLLKALSTESIRNGRWHLLELSGWPDNQSWQNILAWGWDSPGEYNLIVVNYSDSDSQAMIKLPWGALAGREWRMTDLLTGIDYVRNGDELINAGLFVDFHPWGFHFMTHIIEIQP